MKIDDELVFFGVYALEERNLGNRYLYQFVPLGSDQIVIEITGNIDYANIVGIKLFIPIMIEISTM